MSIQRTLACRACDSSKINTRMDGTYRCQDCGDVGEPIERAPKGHIRDVEADIRRHQEAWE